MNAKVGCGRSKCGFQKEEFENDQQGHHGGAVLHGIFNLHAASIQFSPKSNQDAG